MRLGGQLRNMDPGAASIPGATSFHVASAQAQLLDAALRLARSPLASLEKEGHPAGELRLQQLRRLLKSGRGLPLFFPEHELGFRYEPAGVPATIEPPTSIPNQIQKRSEPRTQTSPGTQTSTPSLADGRARGD